MKWLQFASVLFYVYICMAEPCTTPFGDTSECMKISSCTSFFDALANELDNRTADFMRQSKCGCSTQEPMVCCSRLPTEDEYAKEDQLLQGIDNDSLEDSQLAPDGECGEDHTGDRIYGGTLTQIGEFPWMALLWYRKHVTKELIYACGGSLINHRYVLSAAHCVTGKYLHRFGTFEFVRLGEYDVRNETDCLNDFCGDPHVDIRVLRSYPHSGYSDENLNKEDDISLIRLAKRVQYTEFIQPICLDRAAKWSVKDEIVLSGWGKTLRGKSPVKQKVSLPVAERSYCTNLFRRQHGIDLTKSQLCLGGEFVKDACLGDSGGPGVRERADGRWEAIALVSFGYGCGRDGWPGVHTIIADYYDWIIETLHRSNLCP